MKNPPPTFIYIVWCDDIYYTMDGTIVPTLMSVHRTPEGAEKRRQWLSKELAHHKNATYRTVATTISD